MRILAACEKSGRVRNEFSALGHDAWSCDILPSDTPGNHLQCSLEEIVDQDWDQIYAFPPCTDLCVSGALHFARKIADGSQQRSIDFFMMIAKNKCPQILIENPVGIMSTRWRKPDQIIQPWQFGHPESKATCLWLKGLPKLIPTKILDKPACGYWSNQTPSGQNKLGPSADRAALRGITYLGIAKALAVQYGSWEF